MATYFNSEYIAARRTRSNRWEDWANLILAIWLFISPWVLQFGSSVTARPGFEPVGMVGTAAWNAWVMAALIFLVALSALSHMELWQEWLTLIFGAWVFAAPWALGFTPLGSASWDHWGVGALVFLISLWSLMNVRDRGTVQTNTTTVIEPHHGESGPADRTKIVEPPVNRPRNPQR